VNYLGLISADILRCFEIDAQGQLLKGDEWQKTKEKAIITLTNKPMAVAIDPLALISPADVYMRITELRFPHVPSLGEISKVLHGMTPEQRNSGIERANELTALAEIVVEAAAMK
jgi:hypothetical protein